MDGVTTNPSILAKSKRSPYDVLKEIREFIGDEAELHVQAVSGDAHGIAEEAHKIVKELGKNTYVKIPAVPEGFKAMQELKKEGIKPVSYTHLDVYKRQQLFLPRRDHVDRNDST